MDSQDGGAMIFDLWKKRKAEVFKSKTDKGAGVRRVNDWPLYILFGASAGFLIIMLWVASDRSHHDEASEEENDPRLRQANTQMLAQAATGNWKGAGLVAEAIVPESIFSSVYPPNSLPKLPPDRPLGPLENIKNNLNKQEPTQNPRVSSFFSGEQPYISALEKETPEEKRQREKQFQKKLEMFEEALKAPSRVSIDFVASLGKQSKRSSLDRGSEEDDAWNLYLKRFEKARALNSAEFLNQKESKTKQETAHADFDKTGGSLSQNRWALGSSFDVPSSRCTLRSGAVIPSVLLSSLFSNLPGTILGQVSQNVYDTKTGNCLIIPQGTRLIGSYSNRTAAGQTRVLVAWQRLVFPDGRALDLGAMPGTDAAGNSGMSDLVDNHYVKIFGSAGLMSLISAGFNYGKRLSGTEGLAGAVGDASSQRFSEAAAAVLSKNADIPPTLHIRSGYRLNVMVTRDIIISD